MWISCPLAMIADDMEDEDAIAEATGEIDAVRATDDAEAEGDG